MVGTIPVHTESEAVVAAVIGKLPNILDVEDLGKADLENYDLNDEALSLRDILATLILYDEGPKAFKDFVVDDSYKYNSDWRSGVLGDSLVQRVVLERAGNVTTVSSTSNDPSYGSVPIMPTNTALGHNLPQKVDIKWQLRRRWSRR